MARLFTRTSDKATRPHLARKSIQLQDEYRATYIYTYTYIYIYIYIHIHVRDVGDNQCAKICRLLHTRIPGR